MDEYLGALPDHLRPVATRARKVLDAAFPPGASAIRWAHPTWSIGKDPVCYLKMATPKHLTLGFWKGASIRDPLSRLETTGQVMAHIKLRDVEDVDETALADWAGQAIAMSEGTATRR